MRAASFATRLPGKPLFFILLMALCAAPPVFAAEGEQLAMALVPPEEQQRAGAIGAGWTIYLDGRIDEGAAARLRDELARNGVAAASVYLNSRGGELGQGMDLGRLIREHGFSTRIGRQNAGGSIPFAGECYSACVFAFIGGKYRFYAPRSRIGVHRFSSLSPGDSNADAAQIVSAEVVRYLREMQVDVGLFERMSQTGREQILILGKAELERLRVIDNGRQPAEWAIDSLNGVAYLRGAQRTWQGMGTILLSCSEGKVLFRPQFEADEGTLAAADAVAQHLIRFGDSYVPLADPLQPVTIQDGTVSAEFALSREQAARLRDSAAVGYAAQARNLAISAGFSVDTTGAGREKIGNFLKSCER